MHHKFVGVLFQEFGNNGVVCNNSRHFELLVKVSIPHIGVLMKSKKLHTTCNKQKSASAKGYCDILNVVLIITAFWEVSLMVAY
jgi:hypothetical protein